jgi:hypothetical protein
MPFDRDAILAGGRLHQIIAVEQYALGQAGFARAVGPGDQTSVGYPELELFHAAKMHTASFPRLTRTCRQWAARRRPSAFIGSHGMSK